MSYVKFERKWYIGRPPNDGYPSLPAQQTFSRIWRDYVQQNNLQKLEGEALIEWLGDQFGQRNLNPECNRLELEEEVIDLMITNKLVKPSGSRFRRCLSTALKLFRQDESESRLDRLGKTLDVSIRDTPISQRWTTAQELLRYPLAQIGSANLPKMAEEYRIFLELTATLEKNKLSPQSLLDNPDYEQLFRFVERTRPSLLAKWEQRKVLEALPFYLAGRLRESIDAILICFVRKARLLRSRVSEELEEDRRDESLALLERSGKQLLNLQSAIAEALAKGTPEPLAPFQKKLTRLYMDGSATLDKGRLFELIGSRGTYTRKLGHRLVGIIFQGHDLHAKALIEALQEVLEFEPFKKRIPKNKVEKVTFLHVPRDLLFQRQVFEPVVLITLADYLWSGRVTASLSKRFSNIWANIPEKKFVVKSTKWISKRKQQLDKAWTLFEKETKDKALVKDGRLHIRRPRKSLTEQEEDQHRKRHEKMMSKFRIVSIPEVILKVHQSTGFLDELKLEKQAPHQMKNEERLRSITGVLIAMGMNIGIRETASVIGYGQSVGRIQNIQNNYMTKENLESALGCLIRKWDERKMGAQWGPGQLVSVDGRVIGTFQNNLLSRYHYRKGKSGMTVYWFRRDDGIATRVKTLGNQEWESWHILDELLHPLADQNLLSSCGDTQGQFLALWGLAEIVGKEILARFRRPSQVLLYKPTAKKRGNLKNLRTIRWKIIERGLPSILRLGEAIRSGQVPASEVLRRWHLYDENGCNITETLRELGKVARTEFMLKYAQDEYLQRKIRDACNNAEAWNSFHEAIFWGNGGKLRSNDPTRQEEALLALSLLMNSIVFYNVDFYGNLLKKTKAPTPVVWEHIQVLGKYQFKRSWFKV
ncbi:MAG: Tn3 family transposase [Deltaproteobacteria bacterium]|nr:Tn3 family transposase [Deltaproteobacteria bacterium]